MDELDKYRKKFQELVETEVELFSKYSVLYGQDISFIDKIKNNETKYSDEIFSTIEDISSYIELATSCVESYSKEDISDEEKIKHIKKCISTQKKLNSKLSKALDLYEQCQLEDM